MSEAVDKTAAGATRGLLGSYSFILTMLGLEMWTGQHGIQLGLGLFLLILGALSAYAAFFWETAKKVLSTQAQIAIGNRAFEPREKMSNFSVSLLIVIVMPMSPMMLPLVIMIPMTAVMLPVFMLLPLPSAVLPIPRIVVVFVVARSHPKAVSLPKTLAGHSNLDRPSDAMPTLVCY